MLHFPDFSAHRASSEVSADSLFVERWSPRAFQKHDISPAVLERIFDAARWSPSCFNAQPWKIVSSTNESFDDFLGLLVEGNQAWAKECSLIGFMLAEKHFEHNGKVNDWAQFDCGAAWMALSLQARMEDLYTHGMGGFHKDRAAEYLQIDTDQYDVVMAFTIGKLANLDDLDSQKIQAETPNSRKLLSEIWHSV